MAKPNGPVARLCAPEATPVASRVLGIPVRGADPDADGLHDPSCGGCQGQSDRSTCPYSIRQAASSAVLRDRVRPEGA